MFFEFCQAQKVGLVLSGGGALGMAHIGVIKALEENGIPIDYIAGTSAGALVGSFYAAGYTPEEMLQATLRNTEVWLGPGLIINDEYYFSQYAYDPAFIKFPISFRGTKRYLPDNLVSDYEINIGLNEYLARASGKANQNFDSLMVPFRCMAADVLEQKPIVLKSGSLAFAVRASVAVPLFFAPVSNNEYSNLYDGGIYDNFPVQPMIDEFQPDIIIGVHVSGFAKKKEEIVEQGSFIRQLLANSLVDTKTWEKMPSSGILILPDLEGMSSTDFSLSNQLRAVEKGYQATLACIEDIKAVIARRVDISEMQAKRERFRSQLPPLIVDEVEVYGVGAFEKIYIKRLFQQGKKILTFEDIKRGYIRLKSDANYQGSFPEFIYKPETKTFVVRIFVRPSARFTLKFGGSFFTPTDHQIVLGARYQGVSFAAYHAEIELMQGSFTNYARVRGDIIFPTRFPLSIELENRIIQHDKQRLVFTLFNANKLANISQQLVEFSPAISLPLSRHIKMWAGIAFQQITDNYYVSPVVLSTDQIDQTTFNGRSIYFRYHKRTLNKKMYSNQGTELYFSLRFNEGTETFTHGNNGNQLGQKHTWVQSYLRYQSYVKLFRRFYTGVSLDVAASSLKPYTNLRATQLSSPRFEPLQDSPILFLPQLYSKLFAALGLQAVYTLTKNIQFRTEAYYMKSLEAIKQENNGKIIQTLDFNPQKSVFIATAGFTYDTTIGPIGAFINYYGIEGTKFRALFHIGFLLFPKPAWY
ncbi:MAG: patatin-like phospholipase family protein [Bacteroidia bacterium]|nr:patatin-like phospholipase family protein [Bacteroidia bacterium]MDW8158628.1 patatin-like phospholipase family protein [Bacteroidia bacterium]